VTDGILSPLESQLNAKLELMAAGLSMAAQAEPAMSKSANLQPDLIRMSFQD
jgi:hypothetical protein